MVYKPEHWTMLTNESVPHKYSWIYPSIEPYVFEKHIIDNQHYIAVMTGGNDIDLRVKLEGWDRFYAKWQELSGDRFRLVKVETFSESLKTWYMGVFKRGTQPYKLSGHPSLGCIPRGLVEDQGRRRKEVGGYRSL